MDYKIREINWKDVKTKEVLKFGRFGKYNDNSRHIEIDGDTKKLLYFIEC